MTTLTETTEEDIEKGLLITILTCPKGLKLPEGKFFGVKVERRRINGENPYYRTNVFGKDNIRDEEYRRKICGPVKTSAKPESRGHHWTLVTSYKEEYLKQHH